MKTLNFADKESWLAARRGKITGSRLKDIVVLRGTGEKVGYYQLIAERLAIEPDNGEKPMERGTRLEPEAMDLFVKNTKKKVDTSLVIWAREDNESIAVSPDGFIGKTEAVEVKCLSSASHIEAYLTQEVPDEYKFQVLQYFIVNDSLKTLYLVFYDPRFLENISYFVIEVKRSNLKEDIEKYLEYQKVKLAQVDEIVNKLSKF